MSLETTYCSLETLKARLGLSSNDTRDDESLEGIIEAVSRAIDAECFGGESQFYAVDGTRYFTATCSGELQIDDLVAITSLQTDLVGSGVFSTIWAPTDYRLAPYNAQAMPVPRPYWRIEAAPLGTNRFPTGVRRGVQIAGSWGDCLAANRPKQVETVCQRESLYAFQANTTPYGMTAGDGAVAAPPAISLSTYSRLLLAPFRRVTVA